MEDTISSSNRSSVTDCEKYFEDGNETDNPSAIMASTISNNKTGVLELETNNDIVENNIDQFASDNSTELQDEPSTSKICLSASKLKRSVSTPRNYTFRGKRKEVEASINEEVSENDEDNSDSKLSERISTGENEQPHVIPNSNMGQTNDEKMDYQLRLRRVLNKSRSEDYSGKSRQIDELRRSMHFLECVQNMPDIDSESDNFAFEYINLNLSNNSLTSRRQPKVRNLDKLVDGLNIESLQDDEETDEGITAFNKTELEEETDEGITDFHETELFEETCGNSYKNGSENKNSDTEEPVLQRASIPLPLVDDEYYIHNNRFVPNLEEKECEQPNHRISSVSNEDDEPIYEEVIYADEACSIAKSKPYNNPNDHTLELDSNRGSEASNYANEAFDIAQSGPYNNLNTDKCDLDSNRGSAASYYDDVPIELPRSLQRFNKLRIIPGNDFGFKALLSDVLLPEKEYLSILKNALENYNAQTYKPEIMKYIYGEITQLFVFHEKFFEQLELCQNMRDLGQLFIRSQEGFDVYIEHKWTKISHAKFVSKNENIIFPQNNWAENQLSRYASVLRQLHGFTEEGTLKVGLDMIKGIIKQCGYIDDLKEIQNCPVLDKAGKMVLKDEFEVSYGYKRQLKKAIVILMEDYIICALPNLKTCFYYKRIKELTLKPIERKQIVFEDEATFVNKNTAKLILRSSKSTVLKEWHNSISYVRSKR